MKFEWPQITYMVLCLIGLAICAAKHGDMEKINFPVRLVAWLITLFLLIAGGFFSQG